jgi:hypothetical protein
VLTGEKLMDFILYVHRNEHQEVANPKCYITGWTKNGSDGEVTKMHGKEKEELF